jgi:Fe-S-cluster-containing dehydrogenase component/DMSO reductase anchor subunit
METGAAYRSVDMAASRATAIRSPLLRVVSGERSRSELVERLLREQQTLPAVTAVERISRRLSDDSPPAQARYYQSLIPLTAPAPGQQLAFEVDLDACTGCKACVAACHHLNGLDEGEVWRTVGLLHGGSAEAPVQQTVTTACHHCVEPACMAGCPVKAYEKDPVTGVVRHLDDQCIGCQYCTFMCPYDAPKYNPRLGIVRKCDLCADRLAVGEAPACVQGCPNQAIRVTIVDKAQAIVASEAGAFLPGTPAPEQTVPTTLYQSKRVAPRNLLPADFYSVSPQHAHPPLVVMLVLTQLAAGAFAFNLMSHRLVDGAEGAATALPQALFALALGFGALGASLLHLGRPQYAFRAVLGLRTSWLSREALAFGLFAGAGAAYATTLFAERLSPSTLRTLAIGLRTPLEWTAAVLGLLGVFSSVMVYAATGRPHWRGSLTGFRFFATTVLLGAAAVHAVSSFAASATTTGGKGGRLLEVVVVVSIIKLLSEAAALRHVRARQHSAMKRVAVLLVRDLSRLTVARFVCGVLGGIVLPLVTSSAAAAVPSALLLLAGEGLERYLFFKAAPASRMPGALS